MISWIEGRRIDSWVNGAKEGLVLATNGIGYEIQILPRQKKSLPDEEVLSLWIHQTHREDSIYLHGFIKKEERDLFRILIAVNGIGSQMAMSLLETNDVLELIEAIITKDIVKISKAQGVGKKTAERLTIELKQKLSEQFRDIIISESNNPPNQNPSIKGSIQEEEYFNEVYSTLKAIGYEEQEISCALTAVTRKSRSHNIDNKSEEEALINDTEAILKASLVWLSQSAA